MSEHDNILTLTDEDGNDIDFEFVDVLEYNGNEYVVLLPTEEEEGGSEAVILRVEPIEGTEDEEAYVAIEDDEELAAVFALFKEKFADSFTFLE